MISPHYVCLAYVHPYASYIVDENLFYKGVDKSVVSPARLQQSHSLAEPLLEAPSLEGPSSTVSDSDDTEEVQPFHPFTSGDSLLGLTRKHNVRS